MKKKKMKRRKAKGIGRVPLVLLGNELKLTVLVHTTHYVYTCTYMYMYIFFSFPIMQAKTPFFFSCGLKKKKKGY